MIDIVRLEEEEDVEAEMIEADFLPLEGGIDPEIKQSMALGKRKAPSAASAHLLGPICPICAKALGPSTSNQGLNEHIDWCLNKDAVSAASKRRPKKTKGSGVDDTAKRKLESGRESSKKKGDGTTAMMGWLKKEV